MTFESFLFPSIKNYIVEKRYTVISIKPFSDSGLWSISKLLT